MMIKPCKINIATGQLMHKIMQKKLFMQHNDILDYSRDLNTFANFYSCKQH